MRMHLKKDKNKEIKTVLLSVVMIFLLSISIFITMLIKNISNFFLEYSKGLAFQNLTYLINNSITDKTLEYLEKDNLYFVTKNNLEEIEMIDYNSLKVNLFLRDITSNIQSNLLKETTDDFNVPFGRIFNNPFFNQKGPKIPVKITYIGNVQSYIKTSIKEYGINNALVEMTVYIEINVKIMLPLLSDNLIIKKEVPISYQIIKGNVPSYYAGNIEKNSSIYSIPIE